MKQQVLIDWHVGQSVLAGVKILRVAGVKSREVKTDDGRSWSRKTGVLVAGWPDQRIEPLTPHALSAARERVRADDEKTALKNAERASYRAAADRAQAADYEKRAREYRHRAEEYEREAAAARALAADLAASVDAVCEQAEADARAALEVKP